jgi:hypothetical protein
LNIDLGCHVIGEIEKLAAAGYRHQDGRRPFLDSDLGDGYWIVDRFNGASQVDFTDDDESPPECFS